MFKIFELIVPIIIIIISVFGSALIKFYLDNKELKIKNVILTEENKDMSLSIQMELQIFNDIKDIVTNILNKTKADRFLILAATNGMKDLRFATAIYEQHKNNEKILLSIGATGKYIRFEFDSEYKKMLKNVETQGFVNISTCEMLDCDLKSIYESEKINFSKVFFLRRAKIDEKNDRLFYCSVSSHDDLEFSKHEKTIIKTNIDILKHKFENL